MSLSKGIKVPRNRGEEFRKALVELGLFDQGHRIKSDEDHVYLPIGCLDEEKVKRHFPLGEFEVIEAEFLEKERQVSAEDILGRPLHFEMVGDIAIVDSENAEKEASVLMRVHKHINTVIAPQGPVEGEFRTRRFRHVAGESKTVTLHKEHGLLYKVDLEGAYFTPRLGTERLRVAQQVLPNQVVLDMFAGVGPFAFLMAKRGARVIAMDKNPIAVRYMRANAVLNRLESVEILEGDASDLARQYERKADHVIMNLPHSAHQFLDTAIRTAKNGGTVHYYSISPEDDLYGQDSAFIEEASKKVGADFQVLYEGVVRSYAPRRYNVVIDFKVIWE